MKSLLIFITLFFASCVELPKDCVSENSTSDSKSECQASSSANNHLKKKDISCVANEKIFIGCAEQIANSSQARIESKCNESGTQWINSDCQVVSCSENFEKDGNSCISFESNNGNNPSQESDVDLSEIPIQFSISTLNACVLKAGDIFCFGSGANGQSGDGLAAPVVQDTPVQVRVSNNLKFKFLSNTKQGSNHCAISLTEDLYCWGVSIGVKLLPEKIISKNALKWKYVSTNGGTTCAITTQDDLYCWGSNWNGTLGLGDAIMRKTPTLVAKPSLSQGWSLIETGGYKTCAITLEKDLFCWGRGFYGLGRGTDENSHIPLNISSSINKKVKSVSLHYLNACFQTIEDDIYCWGSNYSRDLVPSVDKDIVLTPSLINFGNITPKELSIGYGHRCLIDTEDKLYCWGSSLSAGFGGEPIDMISSPKQHLPEENKEWDKIVAGQVISCALTKDDLVYCWGLEKYGSENLGPVITRSPSQIDNLNPATFSCQGEVPIYSKPCTDALSGLVENQNISISNSCTNQSQKCTYACNEGYVRSGNKCISNPQKRFTDINVGMAGMACGISIGTPYCWGRQFDDWTRKRSLNTLPTPYPLANGAQASKITLGENHACVLTTTGKIQCAGGNSDYQLGINNTKLIRNSFSEVPATSSRTWSQLISGSSHNCALSTSNQIFCWGDNGYAQLGQGYKSNNFIFVEVPAPANLTWKSVQAARAFSTCAQASDDKLYCWSNRAITIASKLSDADVWSPIKTSDMVWKDYIVNTGTICAIDFSNDLFCWGVSPYSSTSVFQPTKALTSRKWSKLFSVSDSQICGLDALTSDLYCIKSEGVDENKQILEEKISSQNGLNWKSISIYSKEMCFIDSSDKSFCIGSNYAYQLGFQYRFPVSEPKFEIGIP